MRRRPSGDAKNGPGRTAAWVVVLATAAATATAGCKDSNGTPSEPPCGAFDPGSGEIPACGADGWCVCGSGACAVAEASCSTGYRLAEPGGLCLSPAQALGLVPSTPTDRPLCGVWDGGPDAEPDAGPEDGVGDDGADLAPDAREDVGADDVVVEDGEAGAPIELVIFSREEMYSAPVVRRRIARDMSFPVPQDFQRIAVRLRLYTGCPTNCDPGAPVATVRLGLDGGGELELLRGVAPVGGDIDWTEDVTDYAPLFTWTHPVVVTLETAEGGWEVDLSIIFEPGPPPREVRAVVPLFDETDVRATTDVAPVLVRMPSGAASAAVRYRYTGHSTDGTGCDATCERTPAISIDGTQRLELTPWRTDCASFVSVNPLEEPAVVGQARNGWCPGALVRTGVSDVTPWLTGLDLTFDTTIPEVDPTTGSWRVSAALVLYR